MRITDRLEKIEKQRNQQMQTNQMQKVREEVAKGVDSAIAHYNSPEAKAHRKKWRELYGEWMVDNGFAGKGRPPSISIEEYWGLFYKHLVSVGFWSAEYLQAFKEDENFAAQSLGLEIPYPECASVFHNDLDKVMQTIKTL